LDLWLDVFETFKTLWLLNGAEVRHVIADHESFLGPKVQETLDNCDVWVMITFFKVDPGLELSVFSDVWVENAAAPIRGLFVGDDIKTGHNAEVALPATNGTEEISIIILVGVYDLSGSEDDFEVGYIVASET
jgi:hypothetical protein